MIKDVQILAAKNAALLRKVAIRAVACVIVVAAFGLASYLSVLFMNGQHKLIDPSCFGSSHGIS